MINIISFSITSPAIRYSYLFLGFATVLWGIACLFSVRGLEARDWAFWFLLLGFSPLLLRPDSTSKNARFLSCMSGLFLLSFFVTGIGLLWPTLLGKIAIIIQQAFPAYQTPIAIAWGIGIAGLQAVIIYGGTRWLAGKQLSKTEAIGILPLLLFIFGLNEAETVFFRFGQGSWNLIYATALVFWFRTVYSKSQSETPLAQTWGWPDFVWLGFFTFLLRLPLTAESGVMLHHWSYYLGPIETLKQGGVLLHDTPSQYGFLSILLPSFLPFSSADSFWVALGLVLLLQFVLVYGAIRGLRFFAGDKILPGVLALVFVLFLGGSRYRNLGVFEAPSTSGYRFLWAFALCLLFLRERRSIGLLSLIFAIGVYWSAESAVYCLFVLFATYIAHLFQCRGKQFFPPWFVGPLLAAAVSFGVIETGYRLVFGIAPDWMSYIEYPLVYGGGFGSMPVHFFYGTTASLVVSLGALAFLLRAVAFEKGTLVSPGAYGVVGFVFATLTYFISRSHPSNILNLFCYYTPLLLILVDKAKLSRTDKQLRTFLFMLFVALFLCTFPRFLDLGPRLWSVAKMPLNASMDDVLDQPGGIGLMEDLKLPSNRPVLDFSVYFPELRLKSVPYTPFYPAYPMSQFALLSPERQKTYLTRYYAKRPLPDFTVIHRKPFEDRWLYKVIHEMYTLTGIREVEGDRFRVIEEFQRGGATAPK